MGKSWSEHRTMYIIVALTALSFLVWISLLYLLWRALQVRGVPVDLLAMIESLSTAVAAAAVFTAGFIAYRELSEISSSRNLEIIDRLFSELNSTENINARHWIFQNLVENPEEGIPALSNEGRDAIKRVLNSLDRVAFLTQPDWVDEKRVMPWMNPMIVKAWIKLRPYVEYERERRQEPDYYRSAQQLAERCVAWRAANLPGAKTTWVKDAL